MRRVELFLVPGEVSEGYLKDKLVITVDVLRSCTTIAYALYNGARSAIPAQDIEEATKLLASLDRGSTLLCGEREGQKIKGFDLGNSPLEYTQRKVKDKTLIMASSNGSPAMARAAAAPLQLACSFVNISRVAEAVAGAEMDPAIVCCGNKGRVALEDCVCGGMLVSLLEKAGAVDALADGNDAAIASRQLYGIYADSLPLMVRSCNHGRYLEGLGFARDLGICARVDSVPVLPAMKDGLITLIEPSKVGREA